MKRLARLPIFLAWVPFLFLVGCSNDLPMEPDVPANQVKMVEHFTISGTVQIGETIDPGIWLTTPSGMTHIRGYTFNVTLGGDLTGDAVFAQNAHWDQSYTGVISGDFSMGEGDILGQTGSLRGQFTGNVTIGWVEGTATLRGRGGLAGYHVTITMVGPLGGPLDYSGEVMIDARP